MAAELTGGGGWRVAVGGENRAPGFEVLYGGADGLVGLSVAGFFAVLAGAHVRGGASDGLRYLEGGADLAVQLQVSERVRLRAGGSFGRAFLGLDGDGAWLPQGFLGASFDAKPFAGGRFALALALRLEVGGYLGDDVRFPAATLALSVGGGGRF